MTEEAVEQRMTAQYQRIAEAFQAAKKVTYQLQDSHLHLSSVVTVLG